MKSAVEKIIKILTALLFYIITMRKLQNLAGILPLVFVRISLIFANLPMINNYVRTTLA